MECDREQTRLGLLNWMRERVPWRAAEAVVDRAPPIIYPGCRGEDAIFVVGDIHGRLDLVEALQARIDRLVAEAALSNVLEVYLGDYLDRGPRSDGVVEGLIRRSRTNRIVCLEGNHEEMLLQMLDGAAPVDHWLSMGGYATARAYGADPADRSGLAATLARNIPGKHIAFLRGLSSYFAFEDYFFVHAGVRPGVPLDRQNRNDLLWIREEFLNHTGSFGPIVVHGHTPQREPQLLANRINLDTLAFDSGLLSCLVIDRDGAFILPP